MGNAESQQQAGQDHRGPGTSNEMRACYYEVLEVERSDETTTEDIKKAYRRLALRYHPDKNHDDPKGAAERFIEIQNAYEVLSDEQERAWYDSHREQILRGVDSEDVNQDRAVVGTTVADLMKFFDSSTFTYVNDGPKGFYTTMRTLFATLDREEEAAAREAREEYYPLPGFGDSNSDSKSEVRQFYSAWMSFSTLKSFSWKDQWKYSDAPDRRIKRAMEKENRRLRDAARREFNDTVKSLIMFIRKRDPRYVKENFDETKLQASLLAASKSQAARAKANFQDSLRDFQEQSWMEVQQEEDDGSGGESEVDEQFECIACKKVYKNEKQFEAHLKGKKHIKATEALRRKMKLEDEVLGVSEILSTNGTSTPAAAPSLDTSGPQINDEDLYNDDNLKDTADSINATNPIQYDSERSESGNGNEKSNYNALPNAQKNDLESDPETVSGSEVESGPEDELSSGLNNLLLGSGRGRKGREQVSHEGKKKIGAAKAKRQKKAEKGAALEAEGKAHSKPRKPQKPYDPIAAIQKARGETTTAGRRGKKK